MADAPDRGVRLAGVAAQSPAMPGFRIRVELLREELALHGVAVQPFLLLTEAEGQRFRDGSLAARAKVVASSRRRLLHELRAARDGFDVTLIQRQVDVLPSLRLERVAADRRRLIWDVDDAIWLDTSSEARLHPLAFLKGSRRKAHWLAGRADHVIAGNRILAEWLGERSERVTVVPSLVETRDLPVRQHHDGDTITLGWIGSAGTARYLAPMRGLLAELKRVVPEKTYRLLVVGGRLGPIEGVEVEQLAWSPEAERRALTEADIGLMPLPDTPWTRGKCAYKALQYMAAGIPAVADDVGVSGEVIGEGGIVVRGEREWLTALTDLTREPAVRSRLGADARRRVEDHFSLRRWAPVLAGIIRGDRAQAAAPRAALRS